MLETNATVADLIVGDVFRQSTITVWRVLGTHPVFDGHRLLHVESVQSGREASTDWPADRAVFITRRNGEPYRPRRSS